MRITGGSLRGRHVSVPAGVIRPAMDRMRESVFAVLGDLSGRSFLDIFSGSGIIALEAASRGADPVEAVEMDPLKRRTLLENVSIAPVRIQCRFMAAELYVKRARRSFDVIFCDPPFPYKFKWELVSGIAESSLMEPGSLLLIHRPREDYPGSSLQLDLRERREYGRSVVDFFEKPGS
ncbi:RsmD family RNA methyltransferase [Breznakiella homolactica]|uniref:RsmD family RNA methyltransferase n=1 Tax=Breznakiella homolactica TaxID=2798577 RepID=A0A7T8B944_9SPIR|nr:RsmD family RNA methyltransferase [Breznakiella homolactica]QQO08072.1 RsmD family RNA methyltransferase [Breznakiella homolactica]